MNLKIEDTEVSDKDIIKELIVEKSDIKVKEKV